MTVDEVQAKLEAIKKKYIPFTDFNFENDLSVEEYIYRIGKWFKSLLDEFETLEETATTAVTESAANAETASNAAETATSAAEEAQGYAETSAETLQNAKDYAKDYADAQDADTLQDAKDYADTKDADTLQDAKDYADTQDADTLQDAKDYADTQDAVNLQTAKSYADNKIDESLSKRNIIIVADSYGDIYYSGDNSSTGKTFLDYLSESKSNNWTIHSIVQSGSSFLGLDTNQSLKYISVLQNISGVSDNDKITDLIVVGGWNDVENLSTYGKTEAQLQTAINQFCSYVNTTYPNARILLVPVGTSVFNTTQRISYIKMLNNYTDPTLSGSKFFSMQDADCILTDTTMFRANQWVHPNDKGGKAIANAILNTLNGEGIGIHRQWFNAVNGGSGNLSGIVEDINDNIITLISAFYEYQNGRNIEFMMMNTEIYCDNGWYFSGLQHGTNSYKKICTLNNPIFVGSNFADMSMTVPVLVKDTDNNWHDCMGSIKLFGKEVQLALNNVNASSGWEGINAAYIGISGINTMRGDAGLCNL